MPEPSKHIYTAICAVAADLAKEGISKADKNQQQGYKFRGIDAVYNHLAPLLSKHQLCILPRVVSREVCERKTAKGGVLIYTTLHVEFDFVSAKDGSTHTVCTVGEAMDSGDKSANKAMSAAYKYAAFQAFCIPTEGDNDADAHTYEVQGSPPVAQHQRAATRRSGVPLANSDQIERLEEWLNADWLDTATTDGVKVLLTRHREGKLTASKAQEALDKLSTMQPAS